MARLPPSKNIRTHKYFPGVVDHKPASIKGCKEYHAWYLPCGSSTSPSPVSVMSPREPVRVAVDVRRVRGAVAAAAAVAAGGGTTKAEPTWRSEAREKRERPALIMLSEVGGYMLVWS